MQAKCFMKLLWTTGLGWDDPLPSDLVLKWYHLIADAQALYQMFKYLGLFTSQNRAQFSFSDFLMPLGVVTLQYFIEKPALKW